MAKKIKRGSIIRNKKGGWFFGKKQEEAPRQNWGIFSRRIDQLRDEINGLLVKEQIELKNLTKNVNSWGVTFIEAWIDFLTFNTSDEISIFRPRIKKAIGSLNALLNYSWEFEGKLKELRGIAKKTQQLSIKILSGMGDNNKAYENLLSDCAKLLSAVLAESKRVGKVEVSEFNKKIGDIDYPYNNRVNLNRKFWEDIKKRGMTYPYE